MLIRQFWNQRHFFFVNHYGLNEYVPVPPTPTQNSYIKALTPSVIVFDKGGVFGK